MFLRDTYASTNDEENMKHWQNKTTELICKAKSTYYRELITGSLKNGKKNFGSLLENLLQRLAQTLQQA